jgi:hypothetical protein
MLNNVKVTFSLYNRRWNIINKPSHVRERIPNALFFFFYFVRPFPLQVRYCIHLLWYSGRGRNRSKVFIIIIFKIYSFYYHTALLFCHNKDQATFRINKKKNIQKTSSNILSEHFRKLYNRFQWTISKIFILHIFNITKP